MDALNTLPGLQGLEPDEVPMTVDSYTKQSFLDQYAGKIARIITMKPIKDAYANGDAFPAVEIVFQTDDGESHAHQMRAGNIKDIVPSPDGTRFVKASPSAKGTITEGSNFSLFVISAKKAGANDQLLAPPPTGRRFNGFNDLFVRLGVESREISDKKDKKKAPTVSSYLIVTEVFGAPQWPLTTPVKEPQRFNKGAGQAPQQPANTVVVGAPAPVQVAGFSAPAPAVVAPQATPVEGELINLYKALLAAMGGKQVAPVMVALEVQKLFTNTSTLLPAGFLAGFPAVQAAQQQVLGMVFSPVWPVDVARVAGWKAENGTVSL